jgi:site-specific DNA recombinase
MKAVLFCRVSSKEQEETGYSLPAQEKLLRGYADKNSFKIGKIFSISESASGHKQREIFAQMVRFVQKQQIEIIVCEKTDRLTRNFKDMVMIDEWLD